MEKEKNIWLAIEQILFQMVEDQKILLLKVGRRIVPRLTAEDMLQPNDYPELEMDPSFRYEEGILAGMLSLQMSLQALRRQQFSHE